jgi:hypothetical protein
MHKAPTASEISSIQRLLTVAKGDSTSAEIIAKALLSTWRPDVFSHLDLISLRCLNDSQRTDIVAVITYVISAGHGLDDIGLEQDLSVIARLWGE